MDPSNCHEAELSFTPSSTLRWKDIVVIEDYWLIRFARRVSVRIYGLGAVALALLGLAWGDFAAVLRPTPNGVPEPSALGYMAAVPFLLAGLAVQWERAAARGALVLIVSYCVAIAALDISSGIAHPFVFGAWYGVTEHLALAASGLIVYGYCAQFDHITAERLAQIGRLVFGICLIYFGLAHLVYFAYTAKMVPAWLPPGQAFWTYVTAAGHIAAGIAILTGSAARLAAILLTAMFIIFAILVHAPTLFIDPHHNFYWAENAVNFALIGSAWVMAAYAPGETATSGA